mgnify:CR=1 FL=1
MDVQVVGGQVGHDGDMGAPVRHDVIFRTPGLHPRFLEEARARGGVLTSEMEVFFQVCPCPILGVTGSDGKRAERSRAISLSQLHTAQSPAV